MAFASLMGWDSRPCLIWISPIVFCFERLSSLNILGVFRKRPLPWGVPVLTVFPSIFFISTGVQRGSGVAHGKGESAKRSHSTFDTNDTKKVSQLPKTANCRHILSRARLSRLDLSNQHGFFFFPRPQKASNGGTRQGVQIGIYGMGW